MLHLLVLINFIHGNWPETFEKDRLFIAMFWPETNGKERFIAGITDSLLRASHLTGITHANNVTVLKFAKITCAAFLQL